MNKPAVAVYKVGHGVVGPVFLAPDFSKAVSSSCSSKKVAGSVVLKAVIDEQGIPRNISFIRATATDLDRLAVRVASLDRFTPAKKDGSPVAAGEKIEVKIDGCLIIQKGATSVHIALGAPPTQSATPLNDFPDQVIFASDALDAASPSAESNSATTPVNRAAGTYRISPGVSAPVAINQPEAEFSDEAREKRVSGDVMISLIVDIHGLPRNARVVRPLGAGLDAKAVQAVERYRFKPAIKDGMEPVPVMVTVVVHFQWRD